MYRDTAGQVTTHWEYKTLVSPDVTHDPDTEAQLAGALNRLGAGGWELVSCTRGAEKAGVPAGMLLLLKRQLP